MVEKHVNLSKPAVKFHIQSMSLTKLLFIPKINGIVLVIFLKGRFYFINSKYLEHKCAQCIYFNITLKCYKKITYKW